MSSTKKNLLNLFLPCTLQSQAECSFETTITYMEPYTEDRTTHIHQCENLSDKLRWDSLQRTPVHYIRKGSTK
jgi:hypothetical protein